MEPFRRVRKELIRDYVGSWYSEDGASAKTLVNLMNQTAKIYTVALAANNPQVMVSTPLVEQWHFARRYEANLNTLISDMELDVTFRSVVMDAFFGIGCACVMMRDSGTQFLGLMESEEDVWFDLGEPWLSRIPQDNLILDISARERSKMRYCGHVFRADYEKVMDEPGFDRKVKAKLTPTSKQSISDPEFVSDIQSGGAVDDDEMKPMIWLQNIFIAENRTIATMVVDQDLPPLIEREWTGSQSGPYKFLSLGEVPDNVMPAPPAINLKGLHDMQNRLHRRMEQDSDAHRVVNIYPPGKEDDAERIRRARRNSWHRMSDPKSIQQIEVGGVDQRDQALALFIQDEYDRFAGNLTAMGGLGAQAATVGQEEMIHGQVSRTEADMRMAVVKFATECITDLGRLMWEDENLELHSTIPIGNEGDVVESSWTPENRIGTYEEYRFSVEPYSMVFKTPEQKLQEMFQTLREIAPLWPMFQAAGAILDAEAIVDEIARLKNRPEFRRFITFAPDMSMMAPGGEARQSPVTSRETIRKNIPTGGTSEARSNMLQQALSGGGNLNSQQKQAMTRRPA